MKFSASRVGLISKPSNKPFFEIGELKLRLDVGHQDTHCAENSLRHSVAWLLGFTIYAIPGSPAKTGNRDGYLKWRYAMPIYEETFSWILDEITFE